jgi:hypothetical protein
VQRTCAMRECRFTAVVSTEGVNPFWAIFDPDGRFAHISISSAQIGTKHS